MDRQPRRDLAQMAASCHDLVVIGGGATGAAIAWDAALRGLSVALVEKNDFSHATSAASSKLIHGGLRYLANFEFGLVRESLRERRIWQSIAAHLVAPVRFIVPTDSWREKLTLRAGLTLYDALSFDRNRLSDPNQRLPGHQALNFQQARTLEPVLAGTARRGALTYYDCQMHSPERLALAMILGAAAKGAQVANYAEVQRLTGTPEQVTGCVVRDTLTGSEYKIRGRLTINASGPWADQLIAGIPGQKPAPAVLTHSKGIHLITRPLTGNYAIAVLGSTSHFFVLPWRGHSIIATTDTPYSGDPDDVAVTEADISELLATVAGGLPGANLTRADVVHSYAGLRPLIADPTAPDPDTYGASRGSEILDHAEDGGAEGMVSAIGGKWTTSRYLAQQIVDLAMRKLDKSVMACSTAHTPLAGGQVGHFAEFTRAACARNTEIPGATIQHLTRNYGSQIDAVTALISDDPAMAERLSPDLPEIAAQIRFAVRGEMAFTLEDAVFRRTGLCTLGPPGDAALTAAAGIMAGELGWDAAERENQIARVLTNFRC